MNNVWEKFGCNDHDVVILVVDALETGTELVNAYKNYGYTPKFPIIDKNNGAGDVVASYGGSAGSGGPTKLIAPDKSYVDANYYDENNLTNQLKGVGCQENSCDDTYSLVVNSGDGDGDHAEGASVTITADAAPSGKEFDKWTGDIDYLADPNSSTTTVTMPAKNITVTATYKDVGPIVKKDNYMVISSWEVGNDDLGISSVTVDSSQKSDTILTATMKLGTSDDAKKEYAWAQISGYADGDFSGVTSVELIYYSDKPVNIVLDQEGLSADGESHLYQLPAASRGHVKIQISEFDQPTWVAEADKTPLDLSKVMSLSFAAVNEGVTTNIEIQGVYLDGFKENTPIVNLDNFNKVNGMRVSSLSASNLVVSGAKKDMYRISIYNATGKKLVSTLCELDGTSIVDFKNNNLVNGAYIVKIMSNDISIISNQIIR